MPAKFERFNAAVCAGAEAFGVAAAVFMIALTCADVLGAKLFLRPVPGSLDMMMLAQLVAVTFAAAGALFKRRHIAVDFFVQRLPRRTRAVLDGAVSLACLALFAVVAWQLLVHGVELQRSREVTATASIPLAPFAYAAALAMVPMCLVLLQHSLGSLAEARRDEP
jgi:TRAP-type C4-dicarboxylate transport system permease small subunit